MKNKLLLPAFFFYALLLAQDIRAQGKPPVLPLSADSLATGNYKDLLTSFFQLSFNHLIGPKKELNFASNPFGVMARRNPDLLVDTNYYRYPPPARS